MIKKITLFGIILLMSCNSVKLTDSKKSRFEIFQVKTNTKLVNELRLYDVDSALSTHKLMFDEFGIWDETVWIKNKKLPILVWKNRKLTENIDEYFSIAADGIENKEEMYSSVVVFDSRNYDCLIDSADYKNLVIDYFLFGLKNLSDKNDFYDVYWNMVNNHDQ